MRLLFFIGLFAIFISGCSYNNFYIKERDTRNAFLEKPLTIPPDINIQYSSYKNLEKNNDYFTSVIFQLIFNENMNVYKKHSNNLSMDSFDMLFLGKLKADKRVENIRDTLNAEYLNITNKNNRFINKILHWKVNESILSPDQEYIEINQKDNLL